MQMQLGEVSNLKNRPASQAVQSVSLVHVVQPRLQAEQEPCGLTKNPLTQRVQAVALVHLSQFVIASLHNAQLDPML